MGFRKSTSCLNDTLPGHSLDWGLGACAFAFRLAILNLALFSVFIPKWALAQTSTAKPDAAATPAAPAAAAPAATASTSTAPAMGCPPPTPGDEGPTKLRVVDVPSEVKRFKIRVDKGKQNIGLPAPKGEAAPAQGECFFVVGSNPKEVIAEIVFQRVTKNAKGVSIWVFSPARRSDAGKTLLNMSAFKASALKAASEAPGSNELLPGENPLVLPSFLLIQNAQHQAANVRTGLALNIPVSGFGVVAESYVPRLTMGVWTNMVGLRVNFASWSAEKIVFRKPNANDNQEATATGNSLQLDLMLRYPINNKWVPRLGVFVSPLAKQTEILKADASATSPQNTQTLTRSGLAVGAEAEVQPSSNFFLQGRLTMSFKETVTVKDETLGGENLSGSGTASRMHLTGVAGVRLPLTNSRRFFFEGAVGNTFRSDKYSEEIANVGQEQQKDVVTFFQAGFGYIL
jgi:hypothetical protein